MTIGETIEQLHHALSDYIEATYHISHPILVAQRRRLLNEQGVIHQRPYLESTPRYESGPHFSELGLDPSVLEMFSLARGNGSEATFVIHDPPYQHQAEAVKQSLARGRSLVVMTGTGSGKTECFLLPILGRLSIEAHRNPQSFQQSAVRAILLYPMNALVNDQLGRLRLLFGNPRIVGKFKEWGGRPARFARYTSRTLYPGIRDRKKDQIRLAPIGDYYVHLLELANDSTSSDGVAANRLVEELQKRGKWPAKPDMIAWYGTKGSRWVDSKSGNFLRCVTLPDDAELLTRHEVLASPPDVLVTNYSMLEYMLMRPIERPIFDRTSDWLKANPKEKLLLVVDEAHLYRGASGTEVALLIRRLRTRLGIPPNRLQVICTSASFKDPRYASEFAAQLTGKNRIDFETIQGNLLLRENAAPGAFGDAMALSQVDLTRFYEEETTTARLEQVRPFLDYRGVKVAQDLERSMYDALVSFPPMGHLINLTMKDALSIDSLASEVFSGVEQLLANRALTVLLALGSLARPAPKQPSLLPCRVHSFHRGLPGLWACMDTSCNELPPEERGGPTGKLFSQPREVCGCRARVLELFTCRNCGSAYARAYTDNIEIPNFLWAEPGGAFRTLSSYVEELEPLDLLLEKPVVEEVEPADYDLVTGRLNPPALGQRVRQVFLRKDRLQLPNKESEGDGDNARPGEFRPCAVCGESAAFGRSSVQDHLTKGDQPFQALITKQIQVQPPSPRPATKLAPLRGRKVLVFSDSRQMAARLAPNLQTYSTQDALRPLIVVGFQRLRGSSILVPLLSLDDLYLAVLVAAKELGIRLRPQLKAGESFYEDGIVEEAVRNGALDHDTDLLQLFAKLRAAVPPESLLRAIVKSFSDRYYGLESLALASIVERGEHSPKIQSLPTIPRLADSPEQKLALARAWFRCWNRPGFWLSHMPNAWWMNEVHPKSGRFSDLQRFLRDNPTRKSFEKNWLPNLLTWFTEQIATNKHRLRGSELSLLIGGPWAYCQACRTTQRPFPAHVTCINCGQDTATVIDADRDPVFVARKGYYRASTVDAQKVPPISPMAVIAAEHTAQLNVAQPQDVFSAAEEHELLFQDIELGGIEGKPERPAIDVLSCTTTMEVGIDIGTLAGVSLRNMPPARANYQQRSGRAGRRGDSVATVTAFGSADSHDEHYFSHPDQMIRGQVDDPTLALDNHEIAQRHIIAFLLQLYYLARLPSSDSKAPHSLFEVLGTVADFKGSSSILNRNDLAQWLKTEENSLRTEIDGWLPREIATAERSSLLDNLVDNTLKHIDQALLLEPSQDMTSVATTGTTTSGQVQNESAPPTPETEPEEGEELPSDTFGRNLLDWLLYKGVLPRYAFPTDVATFYIFDPDRSTRFRPAFRFTPSQGLSIALSQYAPGKEVWVAGKLWTAGALYSPMGAELYHAWQTKRLYYECSVCHYARTIPLDQGERGEKRNCDACGGIGTFGIARYWLRPPGFAHPIGREEGTSPDDQPARSYATRAKLIAPTPGDPTKWNKLNDRLRVHYTRENLLVTNSGPRQEGYNYCTKCGLIEPTAASVSAVFADHRKPYPDERTPNCAGGGATKGLVLGTDFISDILLVSMRVDLPLTLLPGLLATDVALRTIAEALTKAACELLELEASELQAEYRPALTPSGRSGEESEIYLYDTLPGGAGFSRRVGRLGLSVFDKALSILESCPDDCDRSCYRCLRSYKNKFEHDLLDRHLGASLLRFLLTGTQPVLDATRLEMACELLFQDLNRQSVETLKFERNHTISVPGIGDICAPILATRRDGAQFAIGLHGPLTPDDPPTEPLKTLKEYSTSLPLLLVDALVVRKNLPRATSELISKLG